MELFTKLQQFISKMDINSISKERKQILQPLLNYIQEKEKSNQIIRLNFICTHNSRRSHLAQIWAQTMACYFKVGKVFCYSGGTETTVLFPEIATTLQNTGFEVKTLAKGSNPIYSIKYAENEQPIVGFSKKFDDDFNPKSNFCAIMTCDTANEACPFVSGAIKRIPITFKDPKAFDNTPLQAKKYQEISLQIATEMFYVFSKIEL